MASSYNFSFRSFCVLCFSVFCVFVCFPLLRVRATLPGKAVTEMTYIVSSWTLNFYSLTHIVD